MANTFPQIRAAAIDERLHNVFHRQVQLERLCKALTDNVTKIREAIATDYDRTDAEIAVETNLAVAAVKRDYATLQPKEAHAEEYLIAAGKDAPNARKPAGIVYIEPCTHTLLYSVIAPLSAAMAAGNCVIVLLENNLRAVSSLLRQLLPAALDHDTFAIASSPVTDKSILDHAVVVNQNSSEAQPTSKQLSSASQSRSVAVVDRTSDVQLAARELVAARSSFGGKSPYAPDIVVVNEYAKQSFLLAVVSESVKLASSSAVGETKSKASSASLVNETIEALRKADPNLRLVLQESRFAVVEITSRGADIFSRKVSAPVLIVHAFRSLDDAIDTVSSTSDGAPNLSAFHFASAPSAKYLTQFIDANISLANHVPRELLVGPAFPADRAIDLSTRYPIEAFTVARPAYINPTATSKTLSAAMVGSDSAVIQRLQKEAAQPLVEMKRHPGGGVGFFEQGFLMNAALILTTTLSVSGVAIYWAVKHGRRLW